MRNTVIASIPSVPLMSLPNGCVIRRRLRGFEVWGADISEHYTISLNPSGDGATDVIYLGASDLRKPMSERRRWRG